MVDFEYLAGKKISAGDLSYERYNRGKDVAGFDCGDARLNTFLQDLDEVAAYQEQGLGNTTLVYCYGCLVGFFTLSSDSLELRYIDSKRLASAFRKRQKAVIKNIPALTIGRFAVDRRVQRNGVGQYMMRYIVGLALSNPAVAVRLLILQAYPDAQSFYSSVGFEYTEHVKKEKNRVNRTMFFDLEQVRDIA